MNKDERYLYKKKKILEEIKVVREKYKEKYTKLIQDNIIEGDKVDIVKNVLEGLDVFEYFADNDVITLKDVSAREERLKLKSLAFIKKHPVVCEYMTSKGIYDVIAFIKYIERLYNPSLKGTEYHYEKTQAAYYRYLAMRLGVESKASIKKRESEIYDQLISKKKDMDTFVEESKKQYREREQQNYTTRKEELIKFIFDK